MHAFSSQMRLKNTTWLDKLRRGMGGLGLLLASILWCALPVYAHSGAPYPLLMDEPVGPYRLTVWTDPDVGKGTFIIVGTLPDGSPFPTTTSITLSAAPEDGHLAPRTYVAEVRPKEEGPEFRGVVPFDRKGPWRVRIAVQGELGEATVERVVQVNPSGTSVGSVLLWLTPFLALGGLWAYAALRSRQRA